MNTIKNHRLEVCFRYDPAKVFSERFESIGVMDKITLDGKYNFCEPEQYIADRVTCHGVGLCGEYVWDELAEEAAPGDKFPKLGVGLLTQCPDGGAYDMWKHYEVEPFPVHAQFGEDYAVFVQEPVSCLGVAARITKKVWLEENSIHTCTTVENTGERPLKLGEYQHNFVSINGLRTGSGYHLSVPFDGTLQDIEQAAFQQGDFSHRLSGFMQVFDGTVHWVRDMDGYSYHKITEQKDLHMENGAYWRLTHDAVPLCIEEYISFTPERLVMWGIEHCICAEVYVPISVLPGETQSWERTWVFHD